MTATTSFWKDPYVRTALAVNLLIILFSLGLLLYYFPKLDQSALTIHFDKYVHIDFTGTKTDIMHIWLIALLVNGINFVLMRTWYVRERFIGHLIGFLSTAFSGLILLTLGVIIAVN